MRCDLLFLDGPSSPRAYTKIVVYESAILFGTVRAPKECRTCGRIGQFSAWQSYVEALEAFREATAVIERYPPRFNAGPGTRIGVAYSDGTMRSV